MKTYETYDYQDIEGMRPCVKRPITVHALQINEPFNVNTLEGNYKQGKAGDYLMRGVKNELYICDKAIFEVSYDFIGSEADKWE